MSIAAKQSRVVFEKLDRDLRKLRSQPHAEYVHGVRTGIRRVEIILCDLSPNSQPHHKKLLRSLELIRKRAGKVRDLDVQLAALRNFKAARQPRRKTELMNHLLDLRDRQENKLGKLLAKDSIAEIRRRLKRAEAAFDAKQCRDPLFVAHTILAEINVSATNADEAVLHRYRILSKRARYTAELAETSAEGRRFLANVKRIQDVLGDWHDWLILSESAASRLGEAQESPLVAELRTITGAKLRRAIMALTQIRSELVPSRKRTIPAKVSSSTASPSAPSEIQEAATAVA